MTQWFSGSGRKGDKTPGGTPGSAGFSRSRAGRPVRPPADPPRTRPQPPEFDQGLEPNWQPQPARRNGGQFNRPNSDFNRPEPESPPSQDLPPQQYADPYGRRQILSENVGANSEQDFGEDYSQNAEVSENTYADSPERVEFKKRIVALMVDVLACYLVAMTVMLIPFLKAYLYLNLVMCMLLLIRDFPFEGRGIGKNLMGLQVVDAASGQPPSLKQSVLRNLVLIAPYALTQVVTVVLRFIPFPDFNAVIVTIVNVIGALYVLLVIPLEIYRAYNRPDGQRLGDEIAQTEVIESAMDFSKPLPRR